jgi:hypothetical protein
VIQTALVSYIPTSKQYDPVGDRIIIVTSVRPIFCRNLILKQKASDCQGSVLMMGLRRGSAREVILEKVT